ncbi:MAG: alpha/beta hydrolase [Candidatus Kariarchaeaceae archaeon]|jgi:carboxylesterase
MMSKLVKEEYHVEKVPVIRRNSFWRSLQLYLISEGKLLFKGLKSGFADPIMLTSRIVWPKSLDKAIRPQARWFEIDPKKPNGKAILLAHGFGASPEVFRDLAPVLANAGFYVRSIRISGHGTSPGHLATTSGADWLASVAWHYQETSKNYDRIYFLGHSLGGTLGLLLSTIYPIERVVAMCAPIKLNIPPAKFVRQASILVKYWPRSKRRKKEIRELGTLHYDVWPLYAIAGIFEVGKVLIDRKKLLKLPVLYISATHDSKQLQDQSDIVRNYLDETPVEFRVADNSRHQVLEGPDMPQITEWILEWFAN